MEWRNKSVLVTGAGGFIGSHLVQMLLAEGASVRAFLRYTSQASLGWLANLSPQERAGVEPVWGDVRDPDAVRRATDGRDVVFHLAALIGIPYSYVHPREVFETNAVGTLNVLTAARDGAVERVVQFSTSETYGSAQYTPMDEKHPARAQSPYAASKVAGDELARSFFLSFATPVVTVRPFNTYGPRQSTRAIIPTILTQALLGGTVRIGSLHPRRDLTYVTDTCRAVVAAAATDGLEGEALNIGSGFSVSVGDLVELCRKTTGRPFEVETEDERIRPAASEVTELLCDAGKLRDATAWTPGVALEDGVARAADWLRGHLPDEGVAYHR